MYHPMAKVIKMKMKKAVVLSSFLYYANSYTIANCNADLDVTYSEARRVRVKHGHNAAASLYRQLLSQNIDVTAATR